MTVAAIRSRRDEILAAAADEFGRAGYAGARMERIAAAAAVNKQLLFHYFGSKDGLFEAALQNLLQRLEPADPGDGDPPAALRGLTRDLASAAQSAPGVVGILIVANASGGFPAPAAAQIGAWRGRALQRLASAVEDGQRRGFFRDDIDAAEVAAAALAAALGTAALGSGVGSATLLAMLGDYCAWR